MVLVVLAILITALTGVYSFKELCDDFFEGIMLSFATLALGVLFVFVALIPSMVGDYSNDVEYKLSETNEIIALKDNENIGGHIFLMGGYVSEDLYYYYATETESGIKTSKVQADDCYIIYDDKPKIETYESTKFKNKWKYLYAIPAETFYKIYVPNGTVETEFKIDLE